MLRSGSKVEVRRDDRWSYYSLIIQSAELVRAFDTFSCSTFEDFLVNNRRVEVVAKIVPVFHHAFGCAVISVDSGFRGSLGEWHAGKIITVELTDFVCVFLVDDGASIFNFIAVWC